MREAGALGSRVAMMRYHKFMITQEVYHVDGALEFPHGDTISRYKDRESLGLPVLALCMKLGC